MGNLLSNVDVYQVTMWLGIAGLIAVVLTVGYLLFKVVLKESTEDGHAIEQLSREQLSVKRAGTTVYLGDSWQPSCSFGADVSFEGNKFSADKYRSEHHTDLDVEEDPVLVQRIQPDYGFVAKRQELDIDDSPELVQCQIGHIPLPDRDYSCGAAFCDDPACNLHGAKDADDQLLYWNKIDSAFEANHSEKGDLYDTAQ